MPTNIDTRVLVSIKRLNYDFRQFTLESFITHLIHTRQRDIILRPYPFDAELHGFWMRAKTADYVFYNQNTHEIHKVHNVLHELGHIILDHRGNDIAAVLPSEFLSRLGLAESTQVYGQFRRVEPSDSVEEYEAEVFVRHLQREIIFARRIEQLTHRSSSIDQLEKFTRTLGYHD